MVTLSLNDSTEPPWRTRPWWLRSMQSPASSLSGSTGSTELLGWRRKRSRMPTRNCAPR